MLEITFKMKILNMPPDQFTTFDRRSNNLTKQQKKLLDKIGLDYKDKLYNYSDELGAERQLVIDPIEIRRVIEVIIENLTSSKN